MNIPSALDHHPAVLLFTDLYELSMACGYWKLGRETEEGVFHLFFRENAFGGGYTVAAGLGYVLNYLSNLHLNDSDVAYLASLRGADDEPLFEPEFLQYLRRLEFSLDVDAVPEGTVVFPFQPLVRVVGPLAQCQIVESALLNMVNFQTLVATKSARICYAAGQGEDQVMEFGLRRAQGMDGALAASRAAYIGGCSATSNVLAGKLFGIPVRGTHAHSWVMSFDGELEAFLAYARAMPNNCVFLVDTYGTLEGVRRACEAGRRLRAEGREMLGIRLDSGDLAYLSVEARRILDEEGFPDAVIIASNELDEHIITSLKEQGAAIAVWGVGTKLATAFDQPALGGVYKLSGIRHAGGEWQPKVKISEQTAKISTPGVLQVRRFHANGRFESDMVYELGLGAPDEPVIVDPVDHTHRKRMPRGTRHEDLLVPVMRGGEIVYECPPLEESRRRTREQIDQLHPTICRFVHPHRYPAGLELGLHELRTRLILEARNGTTGRGSGNGKTQYA